MFKDIVTTVIIIYAILYAVMCHGVLMACRQALRDPSSLTDELKPIADNIPHGCPEVSQHIKIGSVFYSPPSVLFL